MAVQVTRWQFTAADYERMVETGILGKDDRVELIDGEVIAMSPIGPPHAGIVNRLNAFLNRQLAGTAIVSVQNPIRLNDYSEPQPDLAILQLKDDYYAHAHPTPADILLLVEVADSSLEYDSEGKIPRYAQDAIPEVWLIDVENQSVTQYSYPLITGYRHHVKLERGQMLVAQTISGLEIAIDFIFG
jgi:Uma2 family endonuclease